MNAANEFLTDYEVRIEVFEGPLDLLLYLVQKNELDPKDIPIATITDQYLVFLQQGTQNLTKAGEFLVMAARLIRLKARELLPAEEKDELEEMEYELDRNALIKQMLEYQKYKEVSKYFRFLEAKNFGALGRGLKDRPPTQKQTSEELTMEAGIYELLSAYSSAIKERRQEHFHEVEIDDVTIENQMKAIQNYLSEYIQGEFEAIFDNDRRSIVIAVSFMALLELTKLDFAAIRQHRHCGPIWIYLKNKLSELGDEVKPGYIEDSDVGELKPGLVEYIQGEILRRKEENKLEKFLRELEEGVPLEEPALGVSTGVPLEEPALGVSTGVPLEDTALGDSTGVPLEDTALGDSTGVPLEDTALGVSTGVLVDEQELGSSQGVPLEDTALDVSTGAPLDEPASDVLVDEGADLEKLANKSDLNAESQDANPEEGAGAQTQPGGPN